MNQAKDSKKPELNTGLWWLRSSGFSLFLVGVLVYQWYSMNHYDPENQLVNDEQITFFLNDNWNSNEGHFDQSSEPLIKLKTGIFIQSLQFLDSSQVHLTGYIWQRYENSADHDEIKPIDGEAGFILPEQVDQAEPREIYRKRFHEGEEVCENVSKRCDVGIDWDEELIGWYFQAALRQPFDYSDYPFDHKTVWVRMWAKDFSKNVVLTPDYKAYDATGKDDIFGIENDIVLGTWEREDTFFDYYLSSYNTNFGIEDHVGKQGFPELRYNFVIKRNYVNAFIVYLLPLFLVATLLFSALLTVSRNDDNSNRHGFSTSGFIGAASALFFVVMIAHIQLREEVGGSNIVYIEYFYILMYGVLVAATANTYLFSVKAVRQGGIIHNPDNIIPKLAYWPVILSCLIVITYFAMVTGNEIDCNDVQFAQAEECLSQ